MREHHHSNEDDKAVYYDANGRPHKHHVRMDIRSHGSDGYYSGRHHHHHRKRRPTWQRVLAVVLITIVVLAAVAIFAWRILDAVGRRSLYEHADSTAPTLAEAMQEEAGDSAAAATTDGEEWKAGWVRYNGSVYEYNSNILTFLFLGIDKAGKVAAGKDGLDGGQADGQFLLIMNPDTKKISLFAINRNTMTDVDVYNEADEFVGTYRLQICLAHGYGNGLEESNERAEKAVSKLLYNLPIHGYLALNMGGVAPLVDAVGSVTVPRMTYANGKITVGEDETLNGAQAYSYIRSRGDDFDAASYRLEKQKAFLKSFMSKVKTQIAANPATALNLLSVVQDYTLTDISTSEITYLADQIGSYTLDDQIYSLKGTTTPAEEGTTGHEEFVYDEDALYDTMIQLFYSKVKED